MHARYFNTTVISYDDKAQDISVGYHTKYIYGMNRCLKKGIKTMETEKMLVC